MSIAEAKAIENMPRNAEQLELNWLAETLQQQGVIAADSLVGISKKIIGVGEGLMAELVRVELNYDSPMPDQPQSLIAKFASANQKTRGFASTQNLYGREIGFYTDIGKQAGISTAQCYYAQLDDKNNYFVLLLEDLAPSVCADQVSGCDAQTSQLVIEAFADLHAQWWNSEYLEGLAWSTPTTEGTSLEEGKKLIQNSIDRAHREGTFNAYPTIKGLLKYLPSLLNVEPPPPFPFTLSHGDLRADNVFNASDEGGRFAVIDWQLCCRDQPVRDLARWLVQSITVEQRRETELPLLKRYHQRLIDKGITDYSFKKLKSDYQLSLVVMLLMFAGGMDDIDTSSQRARELIHSMYARLDTALLDWKVKPLLQILPLILPFIKFATWLRMHRQK